MIPRHPTSERFAALYHVVVAALTLGAVLYHIEAARRHWLERER